MNPRVVNLWFSLESWTRVVRKILSLNRLYPLFNNKTSIDDTHQLILIHFNKVKFIYSRPSLIYFWEFGTQKKGCYNLAGKFPLIFVRYCTFGLMSVLAFMELIQFFGSMQKWTLSLPRRIELWHCLKDERRYWNKTLNMSFNWNAENK